MISRRVLETAGFFTIAAALHVSAAAVMLMPTQAQQGAGEAPPSPRLAAGGVEMQDMVSEWEAPPQVAAPRPAPVLPGLSALAPPAALAPQPNLPEPAVDAAMMNLPALTVLPPPLIEAPSKLALDQSARPRARPDRPAPAAVRHAQPEPRREAPPEAVRGERSQVAAQAGQGGRAAQARQGGGAGGQASEAARRNAAASWGAQIRRCISRRVQIPRDVRGGGTVTLDLTVGRNGAILGVGVAQSSGIAALDQAALSGAQRARGCPGAPAEVTDVSASFRLPFSVQGR